MNDEEVIKWAKEKYPQYIENIDLLRSLYKRQVLKESITGYSGVKIPFRRIKDIEDGKRFKVKAIIVEIKKVGIKNKKWASVIIGDNSGMINAMIFQDKDDEDINEGQEYIFMLNKRKDRGIAGEIIEKVEDGSKSINIDVLFEYLYEMNGGRVNKQKFEDFVKKRGFDMAYVKKLFGLEEDGDMIVGK